MIAEMPNSFIERLLKDKYGIQCDGQKFKEDFAKCMAENHLREKRWVDYAFVAEGKKLTIRVEVDFDEAKAVILNLS